MRLFSYLIFALVFIVSCSSDDNSDIYTSNKQDQNLQKFNISYYQNTTLYSIGDDISLKVVFADKSINPDSLVIKIDNTPASFSVKGDTILVNTDSVKSTGTHSILAQITRNNQDYSSSLQIMLRSDIVPARKSYRVIKTYPHDATAYTQGLEFFNNDLYESTGKYGASSLRKVNLSDGVVEKLISIEDRYFAEGLTIINGKIIQLTWQEHIGFIYNRETFKQISTFNLPTEGWGLTHNDSELILSDGTNNIYFLDSSSLAETRRIEVYDDKSELALLNELEYIEGFIYANVYTKDIIAKIDPQTGKVLEYINMEGLLPLQYKTKDTDVLNGIAYKKDTKQLFVTGKNWSKMFEIKIIDPFQ